MDPLTVEERELVEEYRPDVWVAPFVAIIDRIVADASRWREQTTIAERQVMQAERNERIACAKADRLAEMNIDIHKRLMGYVHAAEAERDVARAEAEQLIFERDAALDAYKPTTWFVNWRRAGATIRRLRRRWQWERRRAGLLEKELRAVCNHPDSYNFLIDKVTEQRDEANAEAERLRGAFADQAAQDKGALDGMRKERDAARAALQHLADIVQRVVPIYPTEYDPIDRLRKELSAAPSLLAIRMELNTARAAGYHEACDAVDAMEGVLLETDLNDLRARYPRPVTTAAVAYDSTSGEEGK